MLLWFPLSLVTIFFFFSVGKIFQVSIFSTQVHHDQDGAYLLLLFRHYSHMQIYSFMSFPKLRSLLNRFAKIIRWCFVCMLGTVEDGVPCRYNEYSNKRDFTGFSLSCFGGPIPFLVTHLTTFLSGRVISLKIKPLWVL